MAAWRYLWNSNVRHYIERTNITDNTPSICYVLPSWFTTGWYGTGNQEEYDKIRTLRPCKNCVKKGAPDGPMKDD